MSSNKGKIQVKGIQCPRCDEKIASLSRHNMRYCGCGYCFIDGGQEDYIRTGWGIRVDGDTSNFTKEDWDVINARNKEIGQPKHINFYIVGKRVKRADNFPGYDQALFKLLVEEATDEFEKQSRNRSETANRGTKPRGSKRRSPSLTWTSGKKKATR